MRIFHPDDIAVFFRTKEKYGELSNMCAGFPINILGTNIRTSEALYQACRFPNYPDIQAKIIEQSSPMGAKMVAKSNSSKTREDWMDVRVLIMKWCLDIKLIQNEHFYDVLESTKKLLIVERSTKDDFWGAKLLENGLYKGQNILGGLLTDQRECVKHEKLICIEPLNIQNFKLLGQDIPEIKLEHYEIKNTPSQMEMF